MARVLVEMNFPKKGSRHPMQRIPDAARYMDAPCSGR